MRNSRNKYYERRFNKTNGNGKAQWKIIDELLGEATVNNIKSVHNKNGIEVTVENDIANVFNDFFVSFFNSFDFGESQSNLNSMKYQNSNFFIFPTDSSEVFSIINALPIKQSSGFDGVNTELVRIISPYISEVFSFICNLSFQNGIFPSSLKKAVVIPIYKKGDKKNVANYT